jgi:hypothetical protein
MGDSEMAVPVEISRRQFEEFILPLGFSVLDPNVSVDLRGTRELVYGRIVGKGLSLRVYSSIVPDTGDPDGGRSRGLGEDAIRVALVARVGAGVNSRVKGVGSDRRVHRVAGWRENLQNRLDNWVELRGPACPVCGGPTMRAKGRTGPFWGCANYPACRGSCPVSPVSHAPRAASVAVGAGSIGGLGDEPFGVRLDALLDSDE